MNQGIIIGGDERILAQCIVDLLPKETEVAIFTAASVEIDWRNCFQRKAGIVKNDVGFSAEYSRFESKDVDVFSEMCGRFNSMEPPEGLATSIDAKDEEAVALLERIYALLPQIRRAWSEEGLHVVGALLKPLVVCGHWSCALGFMNFLSISFFLTGDSDLCEELKNLIHSRQGLEIYKIWK